MDGLRRISRGGGTTKIKVEKVELRRISRRGGTTKIEVEKVELRRSKDKKEMKDGTN